MRQLAEIWPLLDDGNFFLVAMSRPGFGLSDRQPGRRVADVVADVDTTLSFLGRDRYASVGFSAGGAYAMACGALDASRCRGVWTLASMAPPEADFDRTVGMAPENARHFVSPPPTREAIEQDVATWIGVFDHLEPDNVLAAFGQRVSEQERENVGGGDREAMVASLRHAVAQGPGGVVDDTFALQHPWGFAVSDITTPMSIWHGATDRFIPASHGTWLAAQVTGARHHLVDGSHLDVLSLIMKPLGAELGVAELL